PLRAVQRERIGVTGLVVLPAVPLQSRLRSVRRVARLQARRLGEEAERQEQDSEEHDHPQRGPEPLPAHHGVLADRPAPRPDRGSADALARADTLVRLEGPRVGIERQRGEVAVALHGHTLVIAPGGPGAHPPPPAPPPPSAPPPSPAPAPPPPPGTGSGAGPGSGWPPAPGMTISGRPGTSTVSGGGCCGAWGCWGDSGCCCTDVCCGAAVGVW